MNFVSNVLLPHVSYSRHLLAEPADSGSSSNGEIHLSFTYEELLRVLAFLAATWLFGWISRRFGFPELVGNVLIGVLLGPELANVCGKFSLSLMLVGEVGFLLLMLEGGLEVDVPMLFQLGFRGLSVAVVGELVSIGSAMAMMTIFGLPPKSSFAAGAVFAPMSTSVLLAVFKQFELLNTPTGQLCLVAAVFDDCYGLILLSELRAVKEGGIKNIIVPLVTSLGWLVIVGFFAIRYFPTILEKYISPYIPKKSRKSFLLGLCFSIAVALASALYYTYASRYLGVFLAGLFFCSSPALQHEVWGKQVKRIHRWLLRVFFAATIGFEIPIRSFWTRRVWAKTAAFLVPFFAKGVVGVFAPAPLKEEFFKVGIAMMSRGEMSFVINRMARSELALIDKETGAALMLTVVIAIFVVPALLSMTLRYFAKRREHELQQRTKLRGPDSIGSSYFRLVIRTPHTFGLLDRTFRVLHLHHMEVLDFRMEYEEDYTILEAYLLESAANTLEARDAELTALRESIKALLSHDPESVRGTDLIVKLLAEMALETGGAEQVLSTHFQDGVFEKAGVGVMVTVWAPWVDDGFLARHTYHPLHMLDVNETASASDLYRRSQDPTRGVTFDEARDGIHRNGHERKHVRMENLHRNSSVPPKELKAADVLRLARKSLAQSRAFRASMQGSAVGEGSTHSAVNFSSYMAASAKSIHGLTGGGDSGDIGQMAQRQRSMTPVAGAPAARGPRFERVSMHLQHANTFGPTATNGGGSGHHNGNGHHAHTHSAEDDEIMARLIAVGIVPPPEPASTPEPSAQNRLVRPSGAPLPLLNRKSGAPLPPILPPLLQPQPSLDSPSRAPPTRSGLADVPEAGGAFHREESMTGAAPPQGLLNPIARKSSVPVPVPTPRSRFGEEADKKPDTDEA